MKRLCAAAVLALPGILWAQNLEPLSDPWARELALHRVLSDPTVPLQSLVVWPPTLEQVQRLLSPAAFPLQPLASSAQIPPGLRPLPTLEGYPYALSYRDSLLRCLAQLSFMLRPGQLSPDTSSPQRFLLARLGARAAARFGEHLEMLLDLANGARLSGSPDAAAAVDPSLGRILKFNIEGRRYFDRYIGYVQLRWGGARVRFGREALSIGYSPIEALILSEAAPLQDGLLLDFEHGGLRFSFLHAAAEGTDTLGQPVTSKFIGLHRLGWEPIEGLSLALYDMIVYSGRGLDLAYLNPLAFFVSAGLGTAWRSNQDNSLLAFELAWRPRTRILLHGTLLVDDLNFSTLFDTTVRGNTNKFAWQVGVVGLVPMGPLGLHCAVEYVRIGPFVFSHRSIVNSWSHLDAPLGYSMQPNSDRWAVQLRYWLGVRSSLTLGLDYSRHGENGLEWRNGRWELVENVGGDLLRGDRDMEQPNRFLRGRRSIERRAHLRFAHEWAPGVMSFLVLGYRHRSGGNFPLRSGWATLEFRLGY